MAGSCCCFGGGFLLQKERCLMYLKTILCCMLQIGWLIGRGVIERNKLREENDDFTVVDI